MRTLLVLVVAAALAAPAAAGSGAATAYSFGRVGGNILPFTIRIAPDGTVGVTGPAHPTKARIAARTLTALATTLRTQRFFELPKLVVCTGTLPDFAASFVTVRRTGTARTVTVRGGCSPRFAKVYAALESAVGVRKLEMRPAGIEPAALRSGGARSIP